jgi:hypothetical protein
MVHRVALAAVVLALALPAVAQTPQPAPPTPPPTTPAPAPPPEQTSPPPSPPASSWKSRLFVGGAFGATFGTVDSIYVAPLVGFHIVPRFDMGVQPFYRWVDDSRYSPSISTNDYGATVFARVRVFRALFLEADYEYTNYEYPNIGGGTSRANYDAFLAGAGYAIPIGGRAAFYVSALYDFSYNANNPNLPYDNPWRVQVGATVGF